MKRFQSIRRHAGSIFLLAAFCLSTALLAGLIVYISHHGALSLGANIPIRGGIVFRAEALLVLTAICLSTGYVLCGTLRDYLHDRQRRYREKRPRA